MLCAASNWGCTVLPLVSHRHSTQCSQRMVKQHSRLCAAIFHSGVCTCSQSLSPALVDAW